MRRLVSPWVVVVLGACSDAETAPACKPQELVVVASDYTSSGVGGLAGTQCDLKFGTDLGKDPLLVRSRGRTFLLARGINDQAIELDGSCGYPIAKRSIASDGATGTSNPQDLAVTGAGALWVPKFFRPEITIVGADGARDRIDLSSYDADGNPNASAIRILTVAGREKAFVALERLDNRSTELPANQTALLVRFDVATRKAEQVSELAGRNPFGLMVEAEGGLYLAAPGNFNRTDEADAGIVRYEPDTGASRLVVSEAALGGSVVQIAIDGTCGAAIVADPTQDVNRTAVVLFDASTGVASHTYAAPLYGPTSGYDLQGLTFTESTLFVGDRRRGDGGYPVHRFPRLPGCRVGSEGEPARMSQKPVAFLPAQR